MLMFYTFTSYKDYINHIKEQQKRINKFKKKLVYEDSLSKLEIEKLRELEEDIKIKIQQLRDSKDLSTSGYLDLSPDIKALILSLL